MSVIKRSGKYHIRLSFQGKVYRLNPHTTLKAEASMIESQIRYALNFSDFGNLCDKAETVLSKMFLRNGWTPPKELPSGPTVYQPQRQITLIDAVEAYVKHESFKKLSKPKDQARKLANVVDYFGPDIPLKDLWIPQLRDFRQHRMEIDYVTPASVNRDVSALSRCFQVALEHRWIESNPCRHLRRLSEKSSLREVYISHRDVVRIMDHVPDWFGDIIWFLYLTGCRRGEALQLKWSMVDLRNRVITFLPDQTKESRGIKKIPIHLDLIPMFQKLGKLRSLAHDFVFTLNGRPVNVMSCDRPWQRCMNKLNWPAPRPRLHDIRHSWLSNARLSGIDADIRQQILGHAGRMKRVDERYGLISTKELVESVDMLEYQHDDIKTTIVANIRKRTSPSRLDQKLTILKELAVRLV